MKKYAIIRLGGQQHKVFEGEEFLVNKLADPKNITPEVLLTSDGKSTKVGTPTVKGVKVKLKVIEIEEKGDKVDVNKYKSKSRYRKHIGFRPKFTRLLLEKIT